MKLAIFVCVALLAVLLQAEDEMAPPRLPAASRIANGRPAAPRQFPYMAFIEAFNTDGYSSTGCAGSLITRSAVLTTVLWCVSSSANRWTVRLGSLNRTGEDPNAWCVESAMAIRHPNYNDRNEDNNIAIIQLPALAPLNDFIQTVTLPSSSDDSSYICREAIVAGWGWTDAGTQLSDVLRWAEVLVVHNDFCKQLTTDLAVTDRQLCAGSNYTTVRGEDHGAPLVLNITGRYTQIGLFSWNTNWTLNPPIPAIYTRVTPYLDWIKSYTESD